MTTRQGWQAYHQGQFDRALTQFDAAQGPEALIGTTLTLLAMGRGSEAMGLAQSAAQQHDSFTLEILVADLVGRQGGRADAERRLIKAVSQYPQDGFLRSLLGEQRIRQGKWEHGTEDFIAAMSLRDPRATAHTQRVIVDMVDAVAARRIPKEDGMRFINRIDYSIAKKPQELSFFFAAARRSINANERLDRSRLLEPWSLHGQGGSGGGSAARPAAPQRSAAPSPSPSSMGKSVPSARSREPRGSMGTQRPTPQPVRTPARKTSPQNQRQAATSKKPQLAQHTPHAHDSQLRERLARREPPQPLIGAAQKNMSAVLRHERDLNEALQDLVADVAPPVWPSQLQTPIDDIPSIGSSRDAILPGSQSINSRVFCLTGGDIQVQITLERCMHNLMAAAHSVKPTILPFIPASIARVAINLLDDFIDAMPELSSLYQEEFTVENPQLLGLGAFLGECIVQTYGAVWHYEDPPEQSKVHLGSQVLDPMGFAREFFESADFEAVSLRSLVTQADQAVKTSTALATFVDHIDPTPGLEKEALLMSLATLWVDYRFVLAETEIQPIAATIKLFDSIEVEGIIPFGIGAQFIPSAIQSAVEGSVDMSGRARMAYVRDNGEFLILASRKHFQRFLEITDVDLSQASAGQFSSWMQDLFRPGWTFLPNPKAVAKARQRFKTDVFQAPHLRQERGSMELTVDAITASGSPRRLRLRHDPADELSPFSLVFLN